MPNRDDTLAELYDRTVLWMPQGNGWQPLQAQPGRWLILTAENPWSQPLTPAMNAARDAVLRAELNARGLNPQRVRGTDPEATWHEDGWCVRDHPGLAAALMQRYQQTAVYVLVNGQRTVLWAESAPDTPRGHPESQL